jgi:glycosyltransferase involved in cell wall biosynthesis
MGVIPSMWPEACPLVAVEAMRAGCPVVASAVGALPEIIGEAGLFAPPGDKLAWQRQLQALVSDDELRARLALLGRHRAMRLFAPEGAVEAIIGLYHTVLEEHVTVPRAHPEM